jgi:hypothetical protein
MPDEPLETVDVRNNRESRAAAATHASPVARASDGGAVPRSGPDAGDLPEPVLDGTADGNPISGVTISKDDAEEAVEANSGPEELGFKGPQGS